MSQRMTAQGTPTGRLAVSKPEEVVVVLVGDARVGKTSMATRFCEDIFIQNYAPTTFNRYISETTVSQRQVRFTVWDTSGARQPDTTRSLVTREADVVLVCYSIADPASLFSAIDFWVPEVRANTPGVPIVLVGCQSDLRGDTGVLDRLGRQGQVPVSSQQALYMSQQIDAVMYVETSSKTSSRGVSAAMEVAALTALGQITSQQQQPQPQQQLKPSSNTGVQQHAQPQQSQGRATPSHVMAPPGRGQSPSHLASKSQQQALSPIQSPVSSVVQSPVRSPRSSAVLHSPLSPIHSPLSPVHPPMSPPPIHHRQSSLTPSSSSTPSPMVSRKGRNRSVSVTRNQQQQGQQRGSQLIKTKESILGQSKDESLLSLEPTEAFWDQFNGPVSPKDQQHMDKTGGGGGGGPTDSPASSRSNIRRSPRSPSLNPIHGSPLPPGGSPMHHHPHHPSATRSPSLSNRNNKLMGSLSSMSMRSKSSTLSSTKSDSSMQSITTNSRNTISITTKTPKMSRKSGGGGSSQKDSGKDGGKEEKMITIKCQRLTADRTYEEVEIEVPAPIYETMQTYTETGSPMPARQPSKSEKRGLGTKIKCLFSKTAN